MSDTGENTMEQENAMPAKETKGAAPKWPVRGLTFAMGPEGDSATITIAMGGDATHGLADLLADLAKAGVA